MTPQRSGRFNTPSSPCAIQTASCIQRMRGFQPEPTIKLPTSDSSKPSWTVTSHRVLDIIVVICLVAVTTSLISSETVNTDAQKINALKDGKVTITEPTLAQAIPKQ